MNGSQKNFSISKNKKCVAGEAAPHAAFSQCSVSFACLEGEQKWQVLN
jgi:hypothetical protein